MRSAPFFARLPATSANLGPGFDAVGLAMSLWLTVEADRARNFAIIATGRDPEICGQLDENLILATYTDILHERGLHASPIAIKLHNQIPLGMGCGSSAAALLAGVLLANHFGELGWRLDQVRDEACRREGHPDNVAACVHGGLTISRMCADGSVRVASLGKNLPWHLTLVLPQSPLRTSEARGLLPETYTRADVTHNVANTALLVAAFASGEGRLLRTAMQDRVHQPFRSEVCPLLPRLLPLAAHADVFGVALSGAGPAVLLVSADLLSAQLSATIRGAAGQDLGEILATSIASGLSLSTGPHPEDRR